MIIEILKNSQKIKKAYKSDAGYDIKANETIVVPAKGKAIVSTNLYLNIPEGYFGLVYSRSGLSVYHNIEVGAGVIDAGYTGEIKVVLYNYGDKNYIVKRGDKIAQLIFLPVISVSFIEKENFSKTKRGKKGFGSTGK